MADLIYPPSAAAFLCFVALFALIAAAKIFWLIMFGVNKEKFRAVEAAAKFYRDKHTLIAEGR